jgi:hypothetical protein
MTNINGRQYEFSDLTLYLGGRDVTGFRGIKYTANQEKDTLYGKGNRPISIQRGNVKYEGELTLTQSELETLTASSSSKSILDLSLNAVVAYGNPSKGDAMITDKLFGIQFTEETKEMKQGDLFMEVTLPFICMNIQLQTA